jgi:hypothetical protein
MVGGGWDSGTIGYSRGSAKSNKQRDGGGMFVPLRIIRPILPDVQQGSLVLAAGVQVEYAPTTKWE